MKRIVKKGRPTTYTGDVRQLLPKTVFYIFFISWSLVVIFHYLKVYPINLSIFKLFFSVNSDVSNVNISHIYKYFLDFFLTAILFFSAYGFGKLVQRIFSIVYDQAYEEKFFNVGLGITALVYLVLLIGWVGVLNKISVGLIIVAGLISSLVSYLKHRQIIVKNEVNVISQRSDRVGFLIKIMVFVLLVTLVYVLITTLTPETFYDSLKYHLALPKYWIQNNKIFPIPNFAYSYYPVNIHILYLISIMFGDEITAKLVHFIFGILTAGTIYYWCRNNFSTRMSIVACYIFLSVPFVLMVMWKTAIEVGLAFFETLAVLCFLNFVTDNKKQTQWLALSAVFCGAAIGGKYLSVYCFIGILFLLILHLLNLKVILKHLVFNVILFVTLSLSIPAPYLIRNFVLTGNAVYPFGFSLKKDVTITVRGDVTEFTDPGRPERTFLNFITLPWNLTMGKKTQEPLSGGILLLLLPLPFFFKKIDLKIKFLLIYGGIYYICWFLVRTYFRYLIPLLPVISIALAYFVTESGISKSMRNLILVTLILLGLSHLSLVIMTATITVDPWSIVSGSQNKTEYLSTQRPGYPNPYYQVVDWINKNLPEDSKILLLGECRAYYLERKFVVQTVSDFNPLILWIKECKTADELYDILQREKVTHILLNVPEAKRLAGYDIFHFEPDELRIFIDFWNKYVVEIYRDIADISLPERKIHSMKKQVPTWWEEYSNDLRNYVYLYKILSKEEASKPHVIPYNFFLEPFIYGKHRQEKLLDIITEFRQKKTILHS